MWKEIFMSTNERIDQAFEKFLDYAESLVIDFHNEVDALDRDLAESQERNLDIVMALGLASGTSPKKFAEAFKGDKTTEYRKKVMVEMHKVIEAGEKSQKKKKKK